MPQKAKQQVVPGIDPADNECDHVINAELIKWEYVSVLLHRLRSDKPGKIPKNAPGSLLGQVRMVAAPRSDVYPMPFGQCGIEANGGITEGEKGL